jgi:FkbM family methyltransferase
MIPNYSQNDEQEIIIKLFNGKKRCSFLDIGANDGKTFSNTYALGEHYDWTGVLVEPSPKAFDKLLDLYGNKPNFELFNVAIGRSNGMMTLHESGTLLNKDDVALVSTGISSEKRRWDSANIEFTEVEVPVWNIRTLLDTCIHKEFDVLSLDIEGMELEVLPSIPLRDLKIACAIIEWNGKHMVEFNRIMYRQGFRIVKMNAENIIYAK